MTEYDTDQQDDSSESQQSEGSRLRSLLEKEKAEKAELARQLAERERMDAFREAGIDLKDSRNQYFVKGYEGEPTVEAIKAKAIEDGFLADVEQQERTTELQAHQRADRATSGEPPAATDVQAEIANAKSEAEVLQILAKHNPEMIVTQ